MKRLLAVVLLALALVACDDGPPAAVVKNVETTENPECTWLSNYWRRCWDKEVGVYCYFYYGSSVGGTTISCLQVK